LSRVLWTARRHQIRLRDSERARQAAQLAHQASCKQGRVSRDQQEEVRALVFKGRLPVSVRQDLEDRRLGFQGEVVRQASRQLDFHQAVRHLASHLKASSRLQVDRQAAVASLQLDFPEDDRQVLRSREIPVYDRKATSTEKACSRHTLAR